MRERTTYLIIGQGLAGTAVAWQLYDRGIPFRILDRGDTVTASRIAAGLITPVTGKRFAVEEHFDELWQVAAAFYKNIEAVLSAKLLHEIGSVRILKVDESPHHKPELHGRIQEASLDPAAFDAPHGALAIPAAARLDVTRYLDASRRFFESLGVYHRGSFESASPDETLIDCTGIAAMRDGRLAPERFQPAKGEILTLRIARLAEDRIVNRGVWIVRIADDRFRAGATYSWDVLDDVPTPAGREEIVRRVSEFLEMPFEVIAHDAATRPISVDRKPIVEQIAPRRWAFNGLGSKGALWSPYYAKKVIDLASGGREISDSRSCKNQNPGAHAPGSPRLTEQVHRLFAGHLQPDDVCIDATAGNGHDTLALAKLCQHVYAFDIQSAALDATAKRLAGFQNFTLILADHAEMASHIPREDHGRVAAIAFNLGYLPGGDKSMISKPSSTTAALQASLELLKPGGLLTVVTYLAHPGGEEEDRIVAETLKEVITERIETAGPRLYVVRKP